MGSRDDMRLPARRRCRFRGRYLEQLPNASVMSSASSSVAWSVAFRHQQNTNLHTLSRRLCQPKKTVLTGQGCSKGRLPSQSGHVLMSWLNDALGKVRELLPQEDPSLENLGAVQGSQVPFHTALKAFVVWGVEMGHLVSNSSPT